MLRPACVPGGGFGCARGPRGGAAGRGLQRAPHARCIWAPRRGPSGPPRAPTPPARGEGRSEAALGRAGPPGCRRAQCAFEDSMARWVPAIRTTYRMSPRSSSTPEPRDPLPGVVLAPPPPAVGGRGAPEGLRDYDASAKRRGRAACGRGLCGRRIKELAGRGGPAPPCNDPSAGSPTETLLRLLLPLGDRVRTASRPRAVVADRPPAGPEASPGRPIGSSDGRCVQRAGT